MTGRDFNSGRVPVSRLEEQRGWLGRAHNENLPPSFGFPRESDVPAWAWRDDPREGEDTKECAA